MVEALNLHLGGRLRSCSSVTPSVLTFHAKVVGPSTEYIRTGPAAVASVLATSMYAILPQVLRQLRTSGARSRAPALEILAPLSHVRALATRGRIPDKL